MNRIVSSLLGACILCVLPLMSMAAPLVAKVDISSQTMNVYYKGELKYHWQVSTARPGKITPKGAWSAKWLSKNHRSSRYNGAKMDYAIFFNGHYAIHATEHVNRLGSPASAGCVRLHPKHAAKLFKMTKKVGLNNMKVVIQQ